MADQDHAADRGLEEALLSVLVAAAILMEGLLMAESVKGGQHQDHLAGKLKNTTIEEHK